MQRLLKKGVAALTAASLILTAPGLGLYQAVAAEFETKPVERPNVSGVSGIGATPLGSLSAPLNPVALPGSAVPTAPTGAAAPRGNAPQAQPAGVSASAAASNAAASSVAPRSAAAAAPASAESSVVPALPGSSLTGAAPAAASAENAAGPSAAAPAKRAAAAGQTPRQGAPASVEREAGAASELFDGQAARGEKALPSAAASQGGVVARAGRWLRGAAGAMLAPLRKSPAAPPSPAPAKQQSPAERAAERLTERNAAKAPQNAFFLAELLAPGFKSGKPLKTIYAFFSPVGQLTRVSDSPRGSGVSLELNVAADGTLSLARNADGALSQHNRMHRAMFVSRRMDGFAQAQKTLAQAQPLLQQKLGLTPAPQIAPAPVEQIVPAPATQLAPAPETSAAEPKAPAAELKTKTGRVRWYHDLLAAGLVSYTMYLTYAMLIPTMGLYLAAVPAMIMGYAAAKLALGALASKRQAYENELAALRLSREPVAEEKATEPAAEEKAPAPAVQPAAQPAPAAEEPAQPKPVEVVRNPRALDLERAQRAYERGPKPAPVKLRHELLAGALVAAAAYGGFVALSWTGLGIGVAAAILVANWYLSAKRSKYRADVAESRRLSSELAAAEVAAKAERDAAEAPAPAPAPAAAAPAAESTRVDSTPAAPAPAVEKTAAGTQEPAAETQPDVEASKAPPTPASWRGMPAEARTWTPERLVAAKKAAQKRARKLAPDAQLVGVSINLDDPKAHYAFTFYSKEKKSSLTVRPRSINVKAWPRGKSAVPLWESRLAALEGLEAAYSRLKAEKSWFKPARVELVPARKGDASWKFTDAKGREVFVGGTAAAKAPVAFISAAGVAGTAASLSKLPADAQLAQEKIVALKDAAQSRARAKSKDAQLVGVSIRLDDERARWNFDFQSKADKKLHTVYPKRVDTEKLAKNLPPIWNTRLAAASFKTGYTALKRARPGFKPVKAQLQGVWNGDPVWLFTDGSGNTMKVRATEEPAPAPAPTAPGDRAPPAPPTDKSPPAPPGDGQAQSPPEAPPQAPAPAPQNPAPPKPNGPHIHEGFFGFRWVQGLTHENPNEAPLKALPLRPTVEQIVSQISRQFALPREQVLALAAKAGITEQSPAAAWLAAYDELRAANREQFKRFDHKKYEGWSSFRRLANVSYPAGWKGTLLRASEVHKHFMGFFVRFPYHLFDMFVLGYFRQNISYEFFHAQEDFINLVEPGVASKYAEAAFQKAAAKSASKWKAPLVGLASIPAVRAFNRYAWSPVLSPLSQFLTRRLTMAFFSAVAMGIVGGLAPGLTLFGVPIMSISLTAIPGLGHGLVLLANGLPAGVGAVPVLGPFLAPVLAAAMGALIKDLVIGPMLNTLLLSTFLTFPRAVKERLMALSERDPQKRVRLLSVEAARAAIGTAFAWSFWKANWKSFFGMITVGAEIEGIMTYAGALDNIVDPGYSKLTHHKFTLFHDLGSAVEKPKGQSLIPFGGAITWGNVLLYKFEDYLSSVTGHDVNISNWIAHKLNHDIPEKITAQQVVAAYSHDKGPGDKGVPFDKDLYKKSPAEIEARLKELAKNAGDLDGEIAAAKAHYALLTEQLANARAHVADLEKQKKPVTPAERAELDDLLKQLKTARNEDYGQGKLAEKHDLEDPVGNTARLKQLRSLQQRFSGNLVDRSGDQPGVKQSLDAQDATLAALQARLTAIKTDTPVHGPDGQPKSRLPQDVLDRIGKLVDQIEAARAKAQSEMANRDAERQLLAVANQSRNLALRERRNGKDMLEFHKNLSRLDTVMALALSLNEIAAAEKAIAGMQALLDKKIAAINASAAQNAANQQQAQQNAGQVQGWKDQQNKTIDNDKSTQSNLNTQQGEAGAAVANIGAFQQDISALIKTINARDGGQSGDALKEYARRLALLPQVVQWRTNGNPNDPKAFSIKGFNDDLVQVNDYIKKAQDGLQQLPGVPVEFAGAVILLVPGPQVNVSNPTKAQALQILSDRKTYWQGQAKQYQDDLASINAMMDPNNTQTTTDEFGNVNPKSLPKWRAQEAAVESTAQSNLQNYLSQIDAAAAQVNAVAGSHLPMLSGMSLQQLEDNINGYGDQVRAVKIPNVESNPQAHDASMKLLVIADLLPRSADQVVQWAYADGVVKQIDSAMSTTLPAAKAKLQSVVDMFTAILADDDKDVAFVNGTSGESNQALLDRKKALLQSTILPPLQGAKDLIQNTLIPYQQNSIASAGPNGDLNKLFTNQQTLMTTTKSLYNTDVAWAVATFGGNSKDPAGSHASIADFRKTLTDNLNGYDDARGHHEGISEYQTEVAHRKDPNFTGTEVLYGETQPFSLPRKISQYTAEKAQRAPQINSQAQQLNEILDKIQSLSGGKYQLQKYHLPTDIGTDAASVARVQALVDSNLISNLGSVLTQIGKDNNTGSSSISVGSQGSAGPPTGVQPPITIPNATQIALLAKDAAQRLVPSSTSNPQSAQAGYAIARLLYSDGVVNSATDALNNQVPQAEVFLAHAQTALNAALQSTSQDDAYVNSNGTSETPDQVYARQLAMFGNLNAFLKEGISFFNTKIGWDTSSLSTIDKMGTYYNGLNTIYTNGTTLNSSELDAANQMKAALQKTLDGLEATKSKVTGWMGQLNDPHDSALRRVNESMSNIQDKTRAVLEANVKWHDVEDQLARTNDILKADLTESDQLQEELSGVLTDKKYADAMRFGLPADLAARIEALRVGRGAFGMQSPNGSQAIVIKKSEFAAFLDTVLGMFSAQKSSQDLGMIRQDLLANPKGLSALIPDSQMVDFGDTADGFYLVYQTQFAVPHGLETGSQVTLGNVAKVWGNNISVTGYQFASPPNAENAPYGDKGIDMNVESLQGKNWVNYLDVDLHRFAFDIPPDGSAVQQARQSRLMVFDDFAVMLFGDRLYIGVAGFGDMALDQPGQHPSYYGGNFKTSLKLNEVMRLNAEQQELFAKDPRTFMQQVNLDFTGYDPDLNQNFDIAAKGDTKTYHRTQIGPQIDVGRLIDGDKQNRDAFLVDMYWAKTGGTDDINQQSLGVSVLKGFTIRDANDKPWLVINNKATAEAGQQYNTYKDRLSVTLPQQGLVVSGQGQIMGSASAYYGEIAKKMGDNANLSLGYGSQYVGMNNRLSITMNTQFTLGELWQAVVDHNRQDLKGGEQLKKFNTQLDQFFKDNTEGDKPSLQVTELKRVFEQDVARKLITQDVGTLRREIDELRKAGAFMDNTRVRGMVGFVSAPVSNDEAERAIGGGVAVGSETTMTLSKSQKALVDAKAQILFREGIRLQERMLELTKQWQASVAEIAQAQWDLKVAEFMRQNAGSDALRAQAEVRSAEAQDRLHQAVLRYNGLSGRAPTDPVPFDNLNAADLQALMKQIRQTVAAPDRMGEILHSLDKDQMQAQLGKDPFNLIDWLPFIDKLTIGFGAQLQDMMSNQVLTAGVTLRIPVYDPRSKASDHAYQLESKATIAEMAQLQADRRLRAEKEIEESRLWQVSADAARPGLPRSAQELATAIRAYRNNLIGPAELQQAFDSWRWYARTVLDADTKAALADAWGDTDLGFAAVPENDGRTVTIGSLQDSFKLVQSNSQTLEEVALRQQAAAEMAQANDHRIQKAFVDLTVGTGFTATGVGWLPSIGLTGFPVMPVLGFEFKPEELRELQVAQGKGQSEYYQALKTKLEAGLAIEFYQSVVQYKTAAAAQSEIEEKLLPQLEAEAAAAQQRGGAAAMDARHKLDEARMARDQAALARQQAVSTLNYLLGRPGDAALNITIDPVDALRSLRAILAEKDPVGAQRRVLNARVETAGAVEQMVDKDLKVEQLSLEPVSLTVRTLGRLIEALTSDGIGNPDLVAAARIQTLSEQRARDSFDGQVSADASRAQSQLALVRGRLTELKPKRDAGALSPMESVEWQRLSGRELELMGTLLSFGVDPDAASSRPEQSLPSSYDRLREALRRSEEKLSGQEPDKPVDLMAPEELKHQAAGFLRYYYAKQTLGKEPIDQSFGEGWIEVRLRYYETDPQVLLALSQLRTQKADRIYRTELAGARAKGDILAADFEANVQMRRWADRAEGSSAPMDQFKARLDQRLKAQAAEIIAMLALPQDTTLAQLEALVPAETTGTRDLGEMSRQFTDQVRRQQLDEVRKTLFEDGLPDQLGGEDDLIHQLRADTIAERMSYKGFTPVAAFGIFRGKAIGGGFIEAPDPRDIQRGLENVLSDVLRKDLEASGRMQQLTLHLHSLMAKVEDGSHEIERRRELVEAAESDYRAQMGRWKPGTDASEVEAARNRLVDAWLGFSEQMVKTKSDFIALVAELEALNLGKGKPITLLQHPLRAELPQLRRDPRAQLLSYWSDRMLDGRFRDALGGTLDGAAATFSEAQRGQLAKLREQLARDAGLYETAARDADAVAARDFTDAEKLDLLTRNDKEGKREAVSTDLGLLLDMLGGLDDKKGPLLTFLLDDIKKQGEQAGADLEEYQGLGRAFRDGAWNALPASFEVRAEYQRLEHLRQGIEEARKPLLRSYLEENGDEPTRFILKDIQLDAYLKAQQDYDDELIKTFSSAAVKGDKELAWRLDGFFDLNATLQRQIDAARAGRGMLALDTLIMLEEQRLLAARWQGRPPQEIDQVALALETLRQKKEAWQRGEGDLVPLYALTTFTTDGQRTWSVDEWLTQSEYEALKDKIKVRDHHEYVMVPREQPDKTVKDEERQIVGGVDTAESKRDLSRDAAQANRTQVDMQAAMKDHDFVLETPVGPKLGYSVEDLFGRDKDKGEMLAAKGRLFFFEAPGSGGPLHKALHPLEALRESPGQYVIYVYEGHEALSRDRYPTLESLKASDQAGDFVKLTMTEKGAKEMVERASGQRDAELRAGWIDVKLNSYGFARDENGGVSDLFLTQEEFDAQVKAYRDAEKNLAILKDEKAQADSKLARAAAVRDAKRESARVASLEYQAHQLHARVVVEAQLEKDIDAGKFPDQGENESKQAFEGRKKIEADKRMQANAEFRDAQKRFDPIAKAATDAQKDWEAAKADVTNAETDVENGEKTLKHSKTWSLYRSKDVSLSMDAQGAVVAARAQPVYGGAALAATLKGGPVANVMSGELVAAAVDGRGRVVAYYQDPKAVAQDAPQWSLRTVEMRDDQPSLEAGAKTVDVRYRLAHYELNTKAGPVPVLLSRRYLIERADDAKSKVTGAEYWGVMPWRWGSLIMELPRGVVGTPMELITGRDPRQQHYLGRVNMYKTEGGATRHHGFFRKVAGFLDVLDFLPDPVDRFYDPSQFPDQVQLDSPVLPGQSVFDKGMRTPDGKLDIHFGKMALKRAAGEDLEDITTAQERTLARFHGGVEVTTIASLRGRAVNEDGTTKQYTETHLQGSHGPESIKDLLANDAVVANDPDSDGTKAVTTSADPGNILVSRVERRVQVRAGADDLDAEVRALDGYPEALGKTLQEQRDKQAGLDKDAGAASRALDAALGERKNVGAKTAALWEKARALAQRIDAEDILEKDLERWRALEASLNARLAWWQSYIDRLLRLRSQPNPTQPGPAQPNPTQPGPTQPNPTQPGPTQPGPVAPAPSGNAWAWVLAAFGALAAVAAAAHLVLRRRPRPS